MNLKGLGGRQKLIIDYMKKGYWIREVHDYTDNTVDRELTDGDNTLFDVSVHTVNSFLKRGIVSQSEWTPSLQIHITEFKLQPLLIL